MDAAYSKLLEDTVAEPGRQDPRLVVMSGPEDGRPIALSKPTSVVGRLETSDVALTLDRSISRKHALIVREGDQYFIEDLNSMYGTEVQGERIRARRALADGDMLRLGETELVFRSAPEKQRPAGER